MKNFFKTYYKALISLAIAIYVTAGIFVGMFEGGHFNSDFITYFTYQSNIIVALTLFMASVLDFTKTNFKFRNLTFATAGIIIFITLIVQNLFIVPFTSATYFSSYADASTHVFSPLFFIIYYYLFETKGGLNYKDILCFLVYPFLYWFICVLTSYEPYFFLEVSKIGMAMAIAWLGILLALFLAVGFCVIALDKKLSKINDNKKSRE